MRQDKLSLEQTEHTHDRTNHYRQKMRRDKPLYRQKMRQDKPLDRQKKRQEKPFNGQITGQDKPLQLKMTLDRQLYNRSIILCLGDSLPRHLHEGGDRNEDRPHGGPRTGIQAVQHVVYRWR